MLKIDTDVELNKKHMILRNIDQWTIPVNAATPEQRTLR